METHSYRDLIVWKKSMGLVVKVYELTEEFPKSELYGLTSQMRRAAVSIPTNIAEGRVRGTRKDYRHFLLMAYTSGAELETEIEIAKSLSFGKKLDFSNIHSLLTEIMKMLNVMTFKMKS